MKTHSLILKIAFIFIVFFSLNANSQELTILHTNDMHSKLTGYGPESEYSPEVINNDSTRGGFARLDTIFDQTKKETNGNILIVDAGDFMMGSLFHFAEKETGFQLKLMKEIGYEYITLGNHEFDFGPEILAEILKAGKMNGEIPQVISSNIVFSSKSTKDDNLESLYKDKTIIPYTVITKNGLKLGIFGLVGEDAENVAPAAKPVEFDKPVKIAKKMAKFLESEKKVDLVICLSHSGIYFNKQTKMYFGEDMILAKKVPTIDIIISGHTHVATHEAIKINNTYIVQAGSYANNVGRIDLKVENHKIIKLDFNLIPVNDAIKGKESVTAEIVKQEKFIDEHYLAQVGLTYNQEIGRTNFDLTRDYDNFESSNLGPFIADASLYYVKSTGNDVDFCLVTSGTIRENLVKGDKGILTVPDLFRVMSLGQGLDNVPGYPLAKIYLTANEVKKLMEVLVISREGGGDGFLFFGGIKLYVDMSKGMFKKVQKIEIDGKEIDFSKGSTKIYTVAANTYLLSFIGEIKKISHGLVNVIPKDANGNPVLDMNNMLIDVDPKTEGVQEAKEWIALIKYMQSFDKQGGNLPVIPEKYRAGDESVVKMKE